MERTATAPICAPGRKCTVKCIYFDDTLPNGFEEHFFFSTEMPYTVSIKQFLAEDIVPLHYAETIEILLCDQLCGEIVIDNRHFPLDGHQLFVIPPYTVHSNNIRPGIGTMYVFKIHFGHLKHYLDAEHLFALFGCTVDQLRYDCPAFDEVLEVVARLMEFDGELGRCLPALIDLFRILSRHTDPGRASAPDHDRFRDSSLQELIRWTNENYARKITIDEVARMTGYSKYHFCSRFKSLTGMTYLNYLNSVRVSYACLLLQKGESVQAVCRATGFENVSYFIQMFKRIQHVTPHQYACQQKKPAEQA